MTSPRAEILIGRMAPGAFARESGFADGFAGSGEFDEGEGFVWGVPRGSSVPSVEAGSGSSGSGGNSTTLPSASIGVGRARVGGRAIGIGVSVAGDFEIITPRRSDPTIGGTPGTSTTAIRF